MYITSGLAYIKIQILRINKCSWLLMLLRNTPQNVQCTAEKYFGPIKFFKTRLPDQQCRNRNQVIDKSISLAIQVFKHHCDASYSVKCLLVCLFVGLANLYGITSYFSLHYNGNWVQKGSDSTIQMHNPM